MRRDRLLLVGAALACLTGGGVVLAQSEPDSTPAAAPDPIGDILREAVRTEPQPAAEQPTPPPAPLVFPGPVAPTPTPAPAPAPTQAAATPEPEETASQEAEVSVGPATPSEPPVPTGPRTRRPIAIVQAIDKITAETMRFEVRVGGPPVRFGHSLLFTARACEVTAADEPVRDAVAYLEIRSQPRGTQAPAAARQVFRGWMYASAPAVTRLEHPVYDAWVVGCKA